MEEEGHSPCTLKKKPKVGLDQGWDHNDHSNGDCNLQQNPIIKNL